MHSNPGYLHSEAEVHELDSRAGRGQDFGGEARGPRPAGLTGGVVSAWAGLGTIRGSAFSRSTLLFAHTARVPSPSAAEKSTGSILDDIGSMFDDLADQLDAMLE